MNYLFFRSLNWICAYAFIAVFIFFLMFGSGCGNTDKPKSKRTDPISETEAAKSQKPLANILTEKEKKNGWKLLFDGQTTSEWTGTKGNGFPETGWLIRDGILTVLGSDGPNHSSGGDIITKDKFGNFELSLEFKIPKGANSGIKYFVMNDFSNQKGYLGLEYQIIDDANHADAKLGANGNRTMASLYDLIPAENKTVKPVGEWNHARIVANGDHVEHWLNGNQVLAYERGSHEFRRLVKASKYRNLQGFGEMQAGHILLQGHGDTVHYRNLKIRILEGS